MHPQGKAAWESILKRTAEKSQTNATNATMPLLRQAIWSDIWKRTVEKSQTNAITVIMHLLGQTIWGHIWKRTVEKSQSNAINVAMPLLRQVIWGDICKHTGEKSNKCRQCNFVSSCLNALNMHLKTRSGWWQINAADVNMPSLRQAIWGDICKHTLEKSQTNAVNTTLYHLV